MVTLRRKPKQEKKFILTGYRHKSIGLYTPKRNKVKLGALVGLFIFCVVTPFSDWLLFVAGALLNKFPLWVFR